MRLQLNSQPYIHIYLHLYTWNMNGHSVFFSPHFSMLLMYAMCEKHHKFMCYLLHSLVSKIHLRWYNRFHFHQTHCSPSFMNKSKAKRKQKFFSLFFFFVSILIPFLSHIVINSSMAKYSISRSNDWISFSCAHILTSWWRKYTALYKVLLDKNATKHFHTHTYTKYPNTITTIIIEYCFRCNEHRKRNDGKLWILCVGSEIYVSKLICDGLLGFGPV